MLADARVTRLDGDYAIVELTGRSGGGCGRCHEPGGCGGSAVIGQLFGPRRTSFRVPNVIGATPGEPVFVELGDGALLKVALMVYLLPVLLLVAGAFLGMALVPVSGDLAAAAGGAIGLALAVAAVVRFQSRRWQTLEPVLARSPASCSR